MITQIISRFIRVLLASFLTILVKHTQMYERDAEHTSNKASTQMGLPIY